MRLFTVVVAIVLGWAAAGGGTARGADAEDLRVVVYRVEPVPGAERPSARTIADALLRVVNRWRAAEIYTVTADAGTTGDRVFVKIPRSEARSADAVRRLTEGRGLVEFRVRADKKLEDDYAARVERYGATPPGCAWIPMGDARRKILVETRSDEPAFTNADVAWAVRAQVPGFT